MSGKEVGYGVSGGCAHLFQRNQDGTVAFTGTNRPKKMEQLESFLSQKSRSMENRETWDCAEINAAYKLIFQGLDFLAYRYLTVIYHENQEVGIILLFVATAASPSWSQANSLRFICSELSPALEIVPLPRPPRFALIAPA